MTDKATKSITEVANSYMKRRGIAGASEKNKNRNQERIENSDLVKDISFYDKNREIYLFRTGSYFEAVVLLEREMNNLRLKFRPTGINVEILEKADNLTPLILFGDKKSPKKFVFRTDSLYLNPLSYLISLENSKGTVLDKLKVDVRLEEDEKCKNKEGSRLLDKKLPSRAVFVERKNPDSHFPDGDYILIDSEDKGPLDSPLNIITQRTVLEKIEEGMLFENGKFSKEITGEEKWCLLLPEDR